MVDWVDLVSLTAATSGTVAVVVQSVAATRTKKRQGEDLERLADAAQARAIDSSDIDTLGRYLFGDIGSVRVSDVVADDRVRARTLKAFSRLTSFVGTDPAADRGEPAAAGIPSQKLWSDDLTKAREQILSGEVWNGLAMMRRHMEIVLRQSAPQFETARMSAGQLISAAARSGTIPHEVVPQLRYAVSVANMAIHGEDVEVDVALEALESADYGLRRLQPIEQTPSDSMP